MFIHPAIVDLASVRFYSFLVFFCTFGFFLCTLLLALASASALFTPAFFSFPSRGGFFPSSGETVHKTPHLETTSLSLFSSIE